MKKLAIVIGHTDSAKGARLTYPFEFIQEYEYNTILAGLIKMYGLDFGKLDIKIFLRDGKGIVRTYDEVERWQADLSIELHFNSFSGNAEGSTVLYGSIPRSNLLAEMANENINMVMENRDRGAKFIGISERGGMNVNSGQVPRILIEPFFGSDFEDARRGLLQIHELAKALLKTAVDFLYR